MDPNPNTLFIDKDDWRKEDYFMDCLDGYFKKTGLFLSLLLLPLVGSTISADEIQAPIQPDTKETAFVSISFGARGFYDRPFGYYRAYPVYRGYYGYYPYAYDNYYYTGYPYGNYYYSDYDRYYYPSTGFFIVGGRGHHYRYWR